MPPYLHPRSNATSALFAGTLLASFIVVGIPHIFPCPRPRRGYADAERKLELERRPVKQKVRQQDIVIEDEPVGQGSAKLEGDSKSSKAQKAKQSSIEEEAEVFRKLWEESKILAREGRGCPVPKPNGALGRLLGFGKGAEK